MSFILDALKKSESDRQRQSGPSLFEVKVAPPRRALPVWAVAIGVLLAINVVVISWMLLRHSQAQRPAAPSGAPAAAPAVTAAAPAAASASPQVRPASSPAGPSGPSGPSHPPASPGDAGAGTVAASPPAAATQPAPATGAGTDGAGASGPGAAAAGRPDGAPDPSDFAPAVPPAASQDSGGASGALPLYRQVVTTDGLPQLHLDLHVYARNPKDRFVMINMHKLVEGASLPNGVHVDAIRPDGVVLSYHGTQFLLPRD